MNAQKFYSIAIDIKVKECRRMDMPFQFEKGATYQIISSSAFVFADNMVVITHQIKNLADNSVADVSDHSLFLSKGNFYTAVLKNKDVPIDTPFKVVDLIPVIKKNKHGEPYLRYTPVLDVVL